MYQTYTFNEIWEFISGLYKASWNANLNWLSDVFWFICTIGAVFLGLYFIFIIILILWDYAIIKLLSIFSYNLKSFRVIYKLKRKISLENDDELLDTVGNILYFVSFGLSIYIWFKW